MKESKRTIGEFRMSGSKKNLKWLKIFLNSLLLYTFSVILTLPASLYSQQGIEYIWPEEARSKLQIIVHIWGEVNKPGQYLVPDGTTVLELISLAGGPNEYSNLSNVRLTREYLDNTSTSNQNFGNTSTINKEIFTINLNKHLKGKGFVYIHALKPGDVVFISHNRWYKVQAVLRTISQIAIVGQVVYYFSRIQY
jgi:hypothetical protein